MKAIILFIFTALSLATAFSQSVEFTGEEKGYFSDGTLKYERHADEDGNYVGQWLEYYAPGRIRGTIDFETQTAEIYHKKEQKLRLRISFCKNLMNREGGLYQEYYPSGELKYEGYYFGRPRILTNNSINATHFGTKKIVNYYREDGTCSQEKKKWPDRTFEYTNESTSISPVAHDDLVNLGGIYYYKKDQVPYTGQAEGFHKNGQLAFSVPIKNGKKIDKLSQNWWDTGTPKKEHIVGDVIDKTIYKNAEGKIMREVDHFNKMERLFHDNGQVKQLISTEGNRRLVFKEFDPEGNVKMEGQGENGLKTGLWKIYTKGKKGEYYLSRKENYKNNLLEGEYRTYTEDGTVGQDGSYVAGKEEGVWNHYRADGSLNASFAYKKGVKEGITKRCFENGELQYEMTYGEGKLNGPMLIYSEEGKVLMELELSQNEIVKIDNKSRKHYLVSGVISTYSPHCGGAYGEGRTYLGGSLYVRSGNTNDEKKEVVLKVNSIEAGRYFAVLEAGAYCFIKPSKINRDQLNRYNEKELGSNYAIRGSDCYENWFNSCDGSLTLNKSNVINFDFSWSERCFVGGDPCLIYNGPYPP